MTTQTLLDRGALIEGRYQLVQKLGEGTFGEVWRAEDHRLSRRAVAIKFLKAEFLARREVVARFEAEADALAQVQHPNVVQVHDRGQWGGTHYLVTEFVEGRAMTAWLDELRARQQLPDPGEALALFDQVCAGIEAAHAVRAPGPIVHRDLKPDNLLIRVQANGEPLVKILDFGIAQLGGRSGTQTGALMGTPLYMAPEQAFGQTQGVGPWTDVFALGVVLAEMLTLRKQVDEGEPWWGTAMQREREIPALLAGLRRDVPPGVWPVVARALSAHGRDRFPHGGALRAALREAAGAGAAGRITPQGGVGGWTNAGTGRGAGERASADSVDAVAGTVAPGMAATVQGFVRGPGGGAVGGAGTGTGTGTGTGAGAGAGGRRVVGVLGVLAALALVGFFGVRAWLSTHAGGNSAPLASRDAGASLEPSSATGANTAAAPAAPPTVPAPAFDPTPALVAAAAPAPGAQPISADPALDAFFQRWTRAVIQGRGAEPLGEFYATPVQFRRSGRGADASAVAHYYAAGAARGDTFVIDWSRSEWLAEDLASPDAARACTGLAGADGPIVKVRAWATEVARNRGALTSGEVPCDRLEGRYLFRLRHVAGALRICHETWALREGVCASCPATRQCQGLPTP